MAPWCLHREERKTEKERERARKNNTPTPYSHPPQTHGWICVHYTDCATLQRANSERNLIIQGKASEKVASEN